MRLELSSFIEGDLDDIAELIAVDNPRRAVKLRPDIGEQARMARVGHHAILFRVVGDVVRIERVAYGGRDLPAIFDPQ
jgi:plasmid stabilization system protein ParE